MRSYVKRLVRRFGVDRVYNAAFDAACRRPVSSRRSDRAVNIGVKIEGVYHAR